MISLSLAVFFLSAFFTVSGWADNDQFQLPGYEKFVMETGLTVYLMERHQVPLIYVSAVVPAGAVKDGAKNGLASLTADALLFGTKSYPKSRIEKQLDLLGASYSTRAHRDWAKVSASFHKKDMETVMPILAEIIACPAFDAEEFEKRKQILLLELAQVKESPFAAGVDYYVKLLYGDHGLANPVRGMQPAASGITLEDVKAFYKDYYKPADSAIAVVGDFQTTDMKKKIREWFKVWDAEGNIPKTGGQPVPVHNKSRVLLVNKQDANEVVFLIGTMGIKRGNPDYLRYRLVNILFGGGGFSCWLLDELRVKRGLAYMIQTSAAGYKDGGIFAVICMTPKPREAIDGVLEQLDRLHNRLDARSLETAKNYMRGQFPLALETSGNLADHLNDMFIYGFDESFINTFSKTVDDTTLAKAREIVAKYYPRENLQLVLVGKASDLRDIAKKYGEVTEKEIKAEGY